MTHEFSATLSQSCHAAPTPPSNTLQTRQHHWRGTPKSVCMLYPVCHAQRTRQTTCDVSILTFLWLRYAFPPLAANQPRVSARLWADSAIRMHLDRWSFSVLWELVHPYLSAQLCKKNLSTFASRLAYRPIKFCLNTRSFRLCR